ncbi:Uncharacterised protein [Streptococcus porcinus]|nr:Uncharacterised protein [Streptococcus porcinus]
MVVAKRIDFDYKVIGKLPSQISIETRGRVLQAIATYGLLQEEFIIRGMVVVTRNRQGLWN